MICTACFGVMLAAALPDDLRAQNPAAPDAQLWDVIESLAAPPATSQPYSKRMDEWHSQRVQLLEKLQLYQRLYPGGTRSEDAMRLEFETRFEIASTAGDFRAFEARVAELEHDQANPRAAEEAAYWRMQCRRLQRTTRPLTDGRLDDTTPWNDYRDYLERFPAAHRAPRFAELLFARAFEARDDDECRKVVELVSRHFPKHPITERLRGRLWRRDALGKPLSFSMPLLGGETADSASYHGKTLLIVVWSASIAASVDAAAALQAQLAGDTSVQPLLMSIDEGRSAVEHARDRSKLAGPIAFDSRGSLRELARSWGVEDVPAILVVDSQGRFVGMATVATWRNVVERRATGG